MRLRSLWAVSVLVIVTGCGDDPSEVTQESAPATPGGDVSATLQQYREDEASDMISVKISNQADTDLVVRSLRLEWAGFVDSGPAPIDYTVFAGTRVDLRIPVSRAICSDPPLIDDVMPDAPITVIAGTTEGDVSFPATDPEGVLGRIWPRDCRRQAVENAVGFTLRDWTDVSADPPTLHASLVVDRAASDEPVTIEAVHGSVLVSVGSAALPMTLDGDAEQMVVPIVATNNRCDSHALGEAKKPYLFQVDLRIGDTPVTYVVSPTASTADALAAGIIGRCPS